MLLVDDDQSEILERQKQRRPCADDQLDLSLARLPPKPPPFRRRYAGVPLARPGAETICDPAQKLRSQRDFRKKHEHLTALLEHVRSRIQINFRLARTGDALQQNR